MDITLRLVNGEEFVQEDDPWVWEIEVPPALYVNAPGPLLREVPATVQCNARGMFGEYEEAKA